MPKFTRKSYKRRKLLIGATLFAAIASISTGFAAFVVSLNAKTNIGGSVEIGAIQNKAVEIIINQEKDPETQEVIVQKFMFEPKKTDTSGRVKNNGTDFESLTVTVSGQIKNTQYISKAYIELTLPESVKKGAEDNFIVLPECAKEGGAELTLTESGTANVKNFTYNVTFIWGSVFGGQNPGEYYDTHVDGKLVDDNTMLETLELFRKTMRASLDIDNNGTISAAEEEAGLKFVITVRTETN